MGKQDYLVDLMNRQGKTAEELIAQQLELAVANGTLSEQDVERAANLLNLRHAIQQNAGEVAKAEQAALELAAAENGVSVATMRHYNALLTLNSELMSSIDKDLAYRQSVLSLEQAHQAASDALSGHGRASQEYRAAALQEEQAVMAVINAKYEQAVATSDATGEEGKHIEATNAAVAEALRLAKTYKDDLPPALQSYLSGMDAATLSANGATVAIDEAGDAVLRLPNGKDIKITADTSDANSALDGLVKKWGGTTVTIRAQLATSGSPVYSSMTGRTPFADGGYVGDKVPGYAVGGTVASGIQMYPNGGLIRGPGGPRTDSIPLMTSAGLVRASTTEYIVNARQTDRFLPVLEAINSGAKNLRQIFLAYAMSGPQATAPAVGTRSTASMLASATAAGGSGGGAPYGRELLRAVSDVVARTVAAVTSAPSTTSRSAPVIGSVTLQAARDDMASALDEVLFRARHAGKGLYDG